MVPSAACAAQIAAIPATSGRSFSSTPPPPFTCRSMNPGASTPPPSAHPLAAGASASRHDPRDPPVLDDSAAPS